MMINYLLEKQTPVLNVILSGFLYPYEVSHVRKLSSLGVSFTHNRRNPQ